MARRTLNKRVFRIPVYLVAHTGCSMYIYSWLDNNSSTL